jgi:intracellular septation protein
MIVPNFLIDFIPVILFLIAFKLYGIYVATSVGIIVTALQVLITRLIKHRFDKQQLITLAVFSVFGGMTLYFHNPIFIKWKPTIVFWIFGLVFLATQFIGDKTLSERMMAKMIEEQSKPIPAAVWRRINLGWAMFFLILGSINLYVAYLFSTEAWVNFKVYGILAIVMLFSIVQAIYLSRFMSKE